MSAPKLRKPVFLWERAFGFSLASWSVSHPYRSSHLKGNFCRPCLDFLEQRFVPAGMLSGNEVALGISDAGAFVTPIQGNGLVGIQFGGQDLVAPGFPLSGFGVSVGETSYLNYSTRVELSGSLTNISSSGTLAFQFVSNDIPGLLITRTIAMPQDSRQILISMTFENLSATKTFHQIATMEVHDPDPVGFETINDVVSLTNGTFVRGADSSGLTLALSSISQSAYASVIGQKHSRLTESDPYEFLPDPVGELPPGYGDPDGGPAEDFPIRLADHVHDLGPNESVTFSSTILVGYTATTVQAEAEVLASAGNPTGNFEALPAFTKVGLSSESIRFSQPLVGLDVSDFHLTRNGVDVPLAAGVQLTPVDGGKGIEFKLEGLAPLTGDEGTYQLSVSPSSRVRDLAGRRLSAVANLGWTLDITAPDPVTLDYTLAGIVGVGPDFASGLLAGKDPVVLSGLGEAGAKVGVSIDGSKVGSISIGPNGKWSFPLDLAGQSDGSHKLAFSIMDAAGNSPEDRKFTLTIDTGAPDAPGKLTLVQDTGRSATDGKTADPKVVISGEGEAGTTITVFQDGGTPIGTAVVDAKGLWSLGVSVNGLGDGSYSFTARATDQAGNNSALSDPLKVLVDTVAPVAPQILSFSPDTGVPGDGITAEPRVTLAGEAEADVEVEITLVGTGVLGSVIADSQGKWTYSIASSALLDGSHKFEARATDVVGNTSGASPTLGLQLDTKAPAKSAIVGVTGDAGSDQVINTNKPELFGDAEAGSLVEVYETGLGLVGSVQAGSDGHWKMAWPAAASVLTEGKHPFKITATDIAGNVSPVSDSLVVIVDTLAPDVPVIQAIVPDTGDDPADRLTNSSAVILQGQAEANSLLTVSLVEKDWKIKAKATADGSWQVDFGKIGNLPDGKWSFVAVASDLAGNDSSPTSSFVIRVDATSPDAPDFKGLLHDTGRSATDRVTSNDAPGLKGQAESLTTIVVFKRDAAGADTEWTRVRADASGAWSLDMSTNTLGEGSHAFVLRGLDQAGNQSAKSDVINIKIDMTSPLLPDGLAIKPETGKAADGTPLTNQSAPNLSGTAESKAHVEIRLDGVVLPPILTESGNWSLSFGDLVEGGHVAEARVIDLAGNTSDWKKISFGVDVTAPNTPESFGITPDTGLSGNDLITSANDLKVFGKADPDSEVWVLLDGLFLGTVRADANGAWEFPLFTSSESADYLVTAIAFDRAGNQSVHSAELAFTVDQATPDAPTIEWVRPDLGLEGDGLFNTRELEIGGMAEPFARVKVFVSGKLLGSATTDDLGYWSLTLLPASQGFLVEGSQVLVARCTDLAGNLGPDSAAYPLVLDLTRPGKPSLVRIDKDTGRPGDLITSDDQPVLVGLGEPGLTIQLYLNGGPVGSTEVDKTGAWQFPMPVSLSPGPADFTLTATDAVGNVSDLSDPVTVTYDPTIPTDPTILGFTPNTGSKLDGITSARQVTVRGIADGGVPLWVYVDGTKVGETLADPAGNWTFDIPGNLADGAYTIKTCSVTTGGRESDFSDPLVIRIDGTAPVVPSIDVVDPDTGAGANDFVTGTGNVVFRGQAEAGSTVEIQINGISVGTTIADGLGKWVFQVERELKNNLFQVRARSLDVADNDSGWSQARDLVVDTHAPEPAIRFPLDNGVFGPTNWVDKIVGSVPRAEFEAEIRVVLVTIKDENTGLWYDGTGFQSASAIALEAALQPATGKVDWRVDLALSQLTDGHGYSVTVQAGDLAGNISGVVKSTFQSDLSIPTVVVTPQNEGIALNLAPLVIDVQFSEPVQSFDATDLILPGGIELVSIAGSGTAYQVTVKPKAEGKYTIILGGKGLRDQANNQVAPETFKVQGDVANDSAKAMKLELSPAGLATYQGEINPGADQDWFTIPVNGLGLEAKLSGVTSPVVLEWMDESGNSLSSIRAEETDSGTLRIQPSADARHLRISGLVKTSYTLSAQSIDPITDPHGDDIGAAQLLILNSNGTIKSSGERTSLTDMEYMRFVAGQTGWIEAVVSPGMDSPIRARLVAFDDRESMVGVAIPSTLPGETPPPIRFPVLAGHTYYLRVDGSADGQGVGGTGTWHLSGRFTADAGASKAEMGTGSLLDLGMTGELSVQGSIDVAGDADLINYQPDESGNYLVQMNPLVTAPGLIPRILVWDEELNLVRETSGVAGQPLTLGVYLESNKVFHIQFAALGGSHGAFEALVASDDHGELTETSGAILEKDGAYSASGQIDLGGDVDLLRLPITQSGVMQIALVGVDGSIDQFGYAASTGRVPFGEAQLNHGKIEVIAGQDLFLRVEGIQGAIGGYELDLQFIPDDYTDKMDSLKARSISVGKALTGAIESFGDRDVFTWTAPLVEGDMSPFRAYRVLAASNPALPMDASIQVYKVNGLGSPILVDSDSDGGQGTDALAFFRAQAGANYLFVVQGASEQDLGGYGISLGEDRLASGDDFPDSVQLASLDPNFQLNGRPGHTLTGEISPDSDTDLVRFVAPSTGSWILRADASAGSILDPFLALIGSNSSEIASDDDGGTGSGSLVVANLVADQEYFLAVTGSTGDGAYVLSAKPFGSGVKASVDDYPKFRPGVLDISGPNPVSVGGMVDFVGDSDSFILDWPINTGFATIVARLTSQDGSKLDPYLELIDSSGQILAQNDNDGTGLSSVLIFDTNPGQRLYLRASGYNKSVGAYSLSVEALKQPVSDDFPGSPDTGAPQIPLAMVGSSQTSVFAGQTAGKIEQVGDRDFTRVVSPIDGFLTANLIQGKGSQVNPYLRGYTTDETGATKVVALDDNSGGGLDSLVQIPVTAGQVIYLQASGAAGSIGAYTLDVSVRQDDIGDLPTSGANILVRGLRASASGAIENGEDKDLFLYRPTKSGSITAQLRGISDSLNPYLFFYRASDGALIASNNDISATNRASRVHLQVDPGESYWVIARSAGGTVGEYDLEITPVLDDYPNSAVLARAFPLGADNTISFKGKIEVTGDTDWIRLTPTVDGILRIHASGDGLDGVDTTLAVYSDSGQILGQSDDTEVNGKTDPSSEVSVAVRAGRTYLVKVAGYGESTGGWKLDITPGSSLNDDLGDTFDTADLLDVSETQPTKYQTFLNAADQDVVRFLAPADGIAIVRFSGSGGELRAFIREGTQTLQVASGAIVSQGGTLRFPVTQGQEVFLVAVAPEDTKIAGGEFRAEIYLEKQTSPGAQPVSGDVVSTLDGTLNSAFTQRIAGGQTEEDYRQIRDQITKSLVESFKAASGGKLTTSYLIIWLDPVDFVVTDAASQQIGNTATQGAILENSSATLSQKGALDLVIIPGAQASSYSMQLYGVGGGRVLAGASMVQSDGTIVNPTVSVNGTQVASGVPVGSVPKEGMTLSLDFRGDQPAVDSGTNPTLAGSTSEAAQQVVGTLLKSVGTGAGSVVVSMAEGIEVPITDLLTLLIAGSVVATTDAMDGDMGDLAELVTPEERQLIALVNSFVVEIRNAFAMGARLFSAGTTVSPSDMLALLRKSLERLGIDGAQSVIDRVGQEAGDLLAGVINGAVRKELVNKPLNRLWTNVLAEIKTQKANKINNPSAATKVLPANANQKVPQKAVSTKPVSVSMAESWQTVTMTTSNFMTQGSPIPFGPDPDQLWLEGWNSSAMEPLAQNPSVGFSPEKTESNEPLLGLVAAAVLAPSWIRSGPPANRTRSRLDENPIRLPENPAGI